MNRQECDRLIHEYLEWLRKGLSVEELDGACELTTPFLDRHNDHMQVYAQRKGDGILLSDDGYVLADLEAGGLEINTPKRQAVLEAIVNGIGVRVVNGRLEVEASTSNVGKRLHALIQAMLAVNDMFVMAQPRVATFFFEDVKAFLDEHDVRYSERIKLAGRSGFDHAIDFLIPRSRLRPERYVQAINAPSRNTISSYLFALSDTREARGGEAEAYAMLNDKEREVGGDVIEALETYAVRPVPWSRREEYVDALAT